MATTISTIDPYQASPDSIMAMQRERDYWEEKYRALGALDVTIDSMGEEGGSWVVTTTREIPAALPAVARRVVGERTIITQTESWAPDGDGGYIADWTCDIKNAPGTFAGTMHVRPARDGEADWHVALTVDAKVPMVGKKLEGIVASQTRTQLEGEYEFNRAWLSSH